MAPDLTQLKEDKTMALTDGEGMNTTMLVSPTGGYVGGNNGFGNGFGGDWAWIILLLLLGWGNNGNGFGGGFGGGFSAEYPWLANGQQNIMANTNNGFRDQMINDNIMGIRDGIYNLSTQLCNCCGDMQMALANGFAGVEQGANARQMANMQTAFGIQTQLAQASADNRLGIANLGSTIISENCADRQALNEGVRDIIASQTAGTQRILDQLCQDKIDAKNDEIANLRQSLAMKDLAASQVAQNAFIQQGFANEVDQLYNRLNSCPVPTTPVYGRTPIFTCNQNQGCGCGCNGGF